MWVVDEIKEPRRDFVCVFLLIIRIKYSTNVFFQQKLYYFQFIYSTGRKHALRKTASLVSYFEVYEKEVYKIYEVLFNILSFRPQRYYFPTTTY